MCEGGSSGSRDPSWARGHSVLPALSSVAGGCLDRRWWLPLSPSVSHTPGGQRESPQGHQAGLPVATKRCLGLGDGAVPAEGRGSSLDVAARPGGSLPNLGDLSRVTPVSVSLLSRVTPVPVQANSAAGAAPGHSQASDAPLHPPACSHRECLPGGTGTGWAMGRAPTGPPWGTGGFFLTLTQDPKACPQRRAGETWGCASTPAPRCRV